MKCLNLNQFKLHFGILLFSLLALGSAEDESTSSKSGTSAVSSTERTESCLVGYDWTDNNNNPKFAWKFASDGTFNYSTTMFGGMSAWGTWSVSKAAEIKISYTRTTEGYLPDDNTLKMLSCDALQIHEGTVMRK